MASTFSPQYALDYAKRYIKNMPIEQVGTQVLDDTNKMMWMQSPWRWTIGAFPNIPLADSTQDYIVTLPDDFLYLQDSYISDQAGGVPRILNIESYLNPGGKLGFPSRIAVLPGTAGDPDTVRVSPQPSILPVNLEVISLYKKQAPVITPSNQNTPGVLVFDDEWFWVYVSGVLYFAYLFGDDQRAGGAQIDPSSGKVTYNGQRGVFEANMVIMRQREKLMGVDSSVQGEQKEPN